jgi:regulator of replication initiation timing
LREELAALKAELAELKDQLSEKTEEAAKLSKELDGEEIALSAQPSPEASDAEVLEQFNNAEPGRQFHIWKQNKKQILRAARRG